MPTLNSSAFEDALALPVDARIELVERLLASLNPSEPADVRRQWEEEAERRVDEINRGKAKLIPGEEVFAELLKKLEA